MKNCKNCIYSDTDLLNNWYCKYDGFHKSIPFPVFLKGGPRKCKCYEDGRIDTKFTYPEKIEGDKK